MKKFAIIASGILTLLAATSCKSNGDGSVSGTVTTEEDTPIAALPDIRGEWDIDNIVFSDADHVRPSEQDPDSRQFIEFTDSTYHIMTNCNSISGDYSLLGDTLTLHEGAMTRMACPDMATEDALRRILPEITTVDVENDSVVRLNSSDNSHYIILHRAVGKK